MMIRKVCIYNDQDGSVNVDFYVDSKEEMIPFPVCACVAMQTL